MTNIGVKILGGAAGAMLAWSSAIISLLFRSSSVSSLLQPSSLLSCASQTLTRRLWTLLSRRHAGHSAATFRDKFWLSFALTIPVVFLSTDVHHWMNEGVFFGYKFGYRHQFALITINSAKLRSRLDLGKIKLRSLTLIYHRHTVFSGNSKSAEGNLVGVRPPLPAPR